MAHVPVVLETVSEHLQQQGFEIDPVALVRLLTEHDPALFIAGRRPGVVVLVVDDPHEATERFYAPLGNDARVRAPFVTLTTDLSLARGIDIGSGPYDVSAVAPAIVSALEDYAPPERRVAQRRVSTEPSRDAALDRRSGTERRRR